MFVTYKLTARVGRAIIGLTCVVSLALVMSCGGNEVCEPGKTRTCPCVDGTEGVQSCRDDGTAWRQCRCGSPADTSPDADGSSTMDTNDQSDVMPDAGPADTGGTDASSDTTTDTTDGGGTDEPEDPLAPSIHQIGDDQPQVTHAIAPLGDGTSAVGGHFAGELLGVEASPRSRDLS